MQLKIKIIKYKIKWRTSSQEHKGNIVLTRRDAKLDPIFFFPKRLIRVEISLVFRFKSRREINCEWMWRILSPNEWAIFSLASLSESSWITLASNNNNLLAKLEINLMKEKICFKIKLYNTIDDGHKENLLFHLWLKSSSSSSSSIGISALNFSFPLTLLLTTMDKLCNLFCVRDKENALIKKTIKREEI